MQLPAIEGLQAGVFPSLQAIRDACHKARKPPASQFQQEHHILMPKPQRGLSLAARRVVLFAINLTLTVTLRSLVIQRVKCALARSD
jgi:hypothetical protein